MCINIEKYNRVPILKVFKIHIMYRSKCVWHPNCIWGLKPWRDLPLVKLGKVSFKPVTFDLCLESWIEFWSHNRSYIPGTNKGICGVSESLVIIIGYVTMIRVSFFKYTDVSYRFVLNIENEMLPVIDCSQCARSRGFNSLCVTSCSTALSEGLLHLCHAWVCLK